MRGPLPASCPDVSSAFCWDTPPQALAIAPSAVSGTGCGPHPCILPGVFPTVLSSLNPSSQSPEAPPESCWPVLSLSLGSIHTPAGEDSLPISILQMGMAKLQLSRPAAASARHSPVDRFLLQVSASPAYRGVSTQQTLCHNAPPTQIM